MERKYRVCEICRDPQSWQQSKSVRQRVRQSLRERTLVRTFPKSVIGVANLLSPRTKGIGPSKFLAPVPTKKSKRW